MRISDNITTNTQIPFTGRIPPPSAYSVTQIIQPVADPPKGWTAHRILRLIVFVLHSMSALFLAVVTTRCGASFITDSFAETLVFHRPAGYPVVADGACSDPRSVSCFFGIPEAYDVAQRGLEWNVFALLAAFEWISASFALGHLCGSFDPARRDKGAAQLACLIWNLVGALWLMPYATPLSLLQTGVQILALLVATTVQYYPIGSEDDAAVAMHYTEYCTSASLLFVGVLILYVPHPPSWAVIIGFTGILLCNLCGVAAHECKLDARWSRAELKFYDLDWGKSANHFKLHLIHSWLGLFMAVFIIFYIARDSFSNPDIPWWVRLILINLLVTYTLFGVWATACYGLAGSGVAPVMFYRMGEEPDDPPPDPRFTLWTSHRLSFGLAVLSACAKIPIVYTVFYGLIGMPGDKVCAL